MKGLPSTVNLRALTASPSTTYHRFQLVPPSVIAPTQFDVIDTTWHKSIGLSLPSTQTASILVCKRWFHMACIHCMPNLYRTQSKCIDIDTYMYLIDLTIFNE